MKHTKLISSAPILPLRAQDDLHTGFAQGKRLFLRQEWLELQMKLSDEDISILC